MTSILFVCLGNICRSPMAEGIFRHHVKAAGCEENFYIDSAGNGSWHEGDPPDPRAMAVSMKNGIDLTNQRSRPLVRQDFQRFNLVLCMDQGNIDRLEHLNSGNNSTAKVDLFLRYSLGENASVPDPYYGGDEGFDQVFDQISNACQALLEKLR